MKIDRRFTQGDTDVFETVEWTERSTRITTPDGGVVFETSDSEVPASWSQLATDIIVSKYFRKAGVPQTDDDGNVLRDPQGQVITGPEKSARQVFHRMVGCWRHFGEKHGYFDTANDAHAFSDELTHMLLNQMAAPNSPQWFNTGLHWAYGLTGPPQGHWVADPETGEPQQAEDAYSHPQPHACFIQSIDDDLVNEGGIMDLWVREARLFKYGSGTGTNFSQLRGEEEPLSGGGKSSGLMSFLKIGDRAAGAIKSGGTTRRAAKMVCLDLDHPDIEAFINWKVREELKVAAMVEGFRHLPEPAKETARRIGLELDYDFNGEAYQTVSGQNSNNSLRITNKFFKRLDEGSEWELNGRTDGKVTRSLPASKLWDQIAYAAWRCADPGVQFDTTINQWHTCSASGRINASNPCSEYMFLDNTACNLASLNLLKFYDAKTHSFDVESFEHAARIWTIVLEISVLMACFPSRQIARLSHEFRTLGLGYANLGAMLMQAGIPYDSLRARAVAASLTAILTGRSYATSAEMAAALGPFSGYYRNKEHMLRVIRNHRRAAYGVPRDSNKAAEHNMGDYESLQISPVPITNDDLFGQPDETIGQIENSEQLLRHARAAWDDALRLGNKHGYRNAQTTVIAPTGTIGLLMDCDTTGVEPDFALVKFKKLAGGGYFKIANQSLRPALTALGYDQQQVRNILTYVMGDLNLEVPMPDAGGKATDQSFADFLLGKGLEEADLRRLNEVLPTVFELTFAFNARTFGEDAIERLDLTAPAQNTDFNLLRMLGLNRRQIQILNRAICGTQTVEGAPHLRDEHLPVFDCANPSAVKDVAGETGKRFIDVEGHIRMMAATQPFISGAISKTINLPHSADVEDIKKSYQLSWELGLKANALYRDGCKLSQPLNVKAEEVDDEVDDQEAIEAGKSEVTAEVASVAGCVATANSEAAAVHAKGPVEKIVERIVERPMRRRLPDTRQSLTHKFNVAGHEGYLTVGLYEGGNPGELFITMAKEGSTIGGLMDSLGTAISVALQYGVPVESLVNKFTHQRFEPAGMTHNPDIPFAKSLVDYIFRWMGIEFIPGYCEANSPRRPAQSADRAAAVSDRAMREAKLQSPGPAPADRISGNGNAESGGTPNAATASDTANPPGPSPSPNSPATETMTLAIRQMQEDAPACDVCGTITVRSGTCYKCLNCGNSMGCS